MAGYDECPGCLGRKSKVAQLCQKCQKSTDIGNRAPNWKGGLLPCPDCGGAKNRESKRCRSCASVARRRFTDPDHLYARDWQKTFRLTPEGKKHIRNMNLKKFGLTLETYEILLNSQGGVCKICKNPESRPTYTSLSVDHDHSCCPGQYSCGKCIRGLLCNKCNRALGLLGDSKETIEAMLDYLGAWDRR